jgi:hypothetical protein
MGTSSQRTGLEEAGLHFAELQAMPLRGWVLRPNPADVDDSFDPEELEAEIEGQSFAIDELVHVEATDDIELDSDFYPEDTGDFEWESVEE